MALYHDLLAAGIPIDHWQSDLFFPLTPASRTLLAAHPEVRAEFFVVQPGHPDAGQTWAEAPFAYAPFWEKVEARAAELSARITGEAPSHV